MSSVKYFGKNVSSVKAHNIQAILMNLLYNEPAYRVSLAEDIAVSTTTVTKLVDELIVQGIIEERAEENEGRRSVGRPHNALFLVKDALHAIGIHIGGGVYRIAIVNLRNEIFYHKFGSFNIPTPYEEVMQKIINDTNQLVEECGICRENIIGIGVGAPGLVNYKTGVIGFAKNQNWKNAPIADMLSAQLNLPVVVENNVRSMALAEALFGVGRNIGSLLFIYGRLGVAAGIVVNREIYRGINLGAGEIGHTFIIQAENEAGSPSIKTTLEDLVSEPALVRKAEALMKKEPNGLLAKIIENNDSKPVIEGLFEAVRQGDLQAKKLVETSAKYLGIAIVNAVNFLNPELILLGGMFNQEKDLYLPILEEMVKTLSFSKLGEQIKIQGTEFDWKAGVLGASSLALKHFFYLPNDDYSLMSNLERLNN
jgi:predicted NBD/HSP70 family sugar kinase